MPPKNRRKVSPGKILIVKPSSLGDIIHSLPLLDAIKHCFPEAEIHWVVARGFEGILEGHPMINRLWVIDKSGWKKLTNISHTILDFKALSNELKKERFDMAIDLQGLLRSGLISKASGAKVRIGLKGYKEAREGSFLFHTDRVSVGKGIVHAVDRYLSVADYLGCERGETAFPLPPSSEVSEHLKAVMKDPYAVFVPGARWPTKRWPPEYFGELAEIIKNNTSIGSLVVGSRDDEEIGRMIEESSGGSAVSIAGRSSLKELVEVIRNARAVISTDSGPMHIASALGVPIVAIFGPTSPERTGPYGKNNIVIRSTLKCASCLKRRCDNFMCMSSIEPKEVADAALRFLRPD